MVLPRFIRLGFFTLLSLALPLRAAPVLSERTREVLNAEMSLADSLFDERAALIWASAPVRETTHRVHRVRESGWYALGLLLRQGSGDVGRALRIFDAMLAQQIDAPGQHWDGTFYRYPEEPMVLPNSIAWKEYDPNWRQFIGTTFALALIEYDSQIPEPLRKRMLASIGHAADGEQHDGRLSPGYTNIALMHAFLCAFAGNRLVRPDLAKVGAQYAEAVYAGFTEHNTFEEFNSPTYYGVDFYGLALWRAHGLTPRMKQLGAEMEATLWRDTAQFYHADLRNLCGPFDRSYGMDMRRYVSLTGLWLRLVLDEKIAPHPPLAGPMDHGHDFFYAPCFAILEPHIPDDALAEFRHFSGERFVTRTLPGNRIATAWLGERLMLGTEATHVSRSAGATSQFHPATIHWLTPDNDVGWVLITEAPRFDGTAAKQTLTFSAIGDLTFRISVAGAKPENLRKELWQLPGLTVSVESDARGFTVSPSTDYIEVTYQEATHYVLKAEIKK
ncbi:MAG TPA: hypothetical protein VKC60_10690 [Opitutaceae bacterium]|nr:hypothetical protein [Opitutaceae bacterium]